MAAAVPERSNRWLFGPAPDLLIGCGVAYMAFFVALVFAGPQLRAWLPLGLLPLVSVFFGTPHYGATLLRVYEKRSERRAYAIFTVWISLALALLFVGGLYSAALGSFLLSLYLTWSPWHYTGQNYGVSLLFLRRRGIEVTPSTKRWIYASFVLSYGLTFLAIHGSSYSADYAPADYNGSVYQFLRFGIPAPFWIWAWGVLGAGYVVSTVMAARDLIRRAPRVADLLPTGLLVLTQALWFSLPPLGRELGLLSGVDPFRPDNASFLFIWVAAGHAAQYLWISTFYAGPRSSTERIGYYGRCIAAGSAIWSLPALLYLWSGWEGSSFGGIASGDDTGVLVAAVVNLHHFVIDGAIWKLRDGRVARALIRRDPAAALEDLESPRRRWLAPVLLGAGALWAASTVLSLIERDRFFGPALTHGDVARAEASLRRLSWIRRDGIADHLRLANAADQRGDAAAVLRILDRAIERHARSETFTAKATFLESQRRSDEAFAVVEQGLAAYPDDLELLHRSGRLLLERGDVDAALRALEHAHALAPSDRRIELTLERARREQAGAADLSSGA